MKLWLKSTCLFLRLNFYLLRSILSTAKGTAAPLDPCVFVCFSFLSFFRKALSFSFLWWVGCSPLAHAPGDGKDSDHVSSKRSDIIRKWYICIFEIEIFNLQIQVIIASTLRTTDNKVGRIVTEHFEWCIYSHTVFEYDQWTKNITFIG